MTEQPGNALTESQGQVRPPDEAPGEVAGGVASGVAGLAVAAGAVAWTHMLGGRKARVVEADGSEVMFEVAVRDDDPRTVTVAQLSDQQIVEPGMMTAEEWAERAVPLTVEQRRVPGPERQARPQVARSEDQPPAEPGGREPTVTELAAVAGVTIEKLPDQSYVLRGADLPEGGLFVEADKLRAVVARVGDGTWREV